MEGESPAVKKLRELAQKGSASEQEMQRGFLQFIKGEKTEEELDMQIEITKKNKS